VHAELQHGAPHSHLYHVKYKEPSIGMVVKRQKGELRATNINC
jgi:hypothetical protein